MVLLLVLVTGGIYMCFIVSHFALNIVGFWERIPECLHKAVKCIWSPWKGCLAKGCSVESDTRVWVSRWKGWDFTVTLESPSLFWHLDHLPRGAQLPGVVLPWSQSSHGCSPVASWGWGLREIVQTLGVGSSEREESLETISCLSQGVVA